MYQHMLPSYRDAFPIARGLLLRHDSAARKATVKWTTGGVSFVLPGSDPNHHPYIAKGGYPRILGKCISTCYQAIVDEAKGQKVDTNVYINVEHKDYLTPTTCVFYAHREYLLDAPNHMATLTVR
jgi:hypothetical protein